MQQLKKEDLRLFLKFAKFLLPYWKTELLVIVLGEVAVVFGLANPYLSKLLIDKGLLAKDPTFFIIIGLSMGGLFILTGLLNAATTYLSSYLNLKLRFDLHKKVFGHLTKLSFSFFQEKSTGGHIYRISYDIDRVISFITSSLSEILTILPRTLFIFAIIFYLDRQLALLSLFLIPFLYFVPYYFMQRLKTLYEELFKNSQDIYERLAEVFSHIQLVKAFGKEINEFRAYLRQLIINLKLSKKTTKLGAMSSFSGNVMSRLVSGIIFFYGGYWVIKGRLTFGSLTAIMLYINQLFGLQSRFANFFQQVAMGTLSCSRIDEILSQEPQIKASPDASLVKFTKGEIVFKEVRFAYGDKKPILENMNFRIEPGTHIALIGPSGCGKTTIINLILRLFEPQNGEIFIDGNNLEKIKFEALYEQIGIALQEPFLWNDTVENNIKYGKPNATQDEIMSVAQLTGIDSFINELPQKYDTKIGENATLLSEGQKQRIAIARAVIKKPAILILDEALSSLDVSSETRILEELLGKRKNLTCIIISHRLSMLNFVDRVYFLKSQNEIIISSTKEFLDSLEYKNLEFAKLQRDL
ncbi:MAG: ABC transporter ATP-binding protein [Candidatus Omnitrophota bacterium]